MSCFSAFSPQKGALTEVPTPLVEVAKRFSAFSPSERGSDVYNRDPNTVKFRIVSVPFPLRKGL